MRTEARGGHWDLAIVGGGPAGMTAAMEGARRGLSVVLLDEQSWPGGQIYRNAGQRRPELLEALGADYAHGMALVDRFRQAPVDYIPGATVWDVTPEREIAFAREGATGVVSADYLVLATGAMERPVPIPGWTRPGVMTVGAGQILLKTAGLVPQEPVVLAGSGPLLLLLAWQYLRAGATVRAIVETAPRANRWRAAPYLPHLLRQTKLLRKGRGWLRDLAAAGVERVEGATALRIEGDGACAGLSFEAGGRRRTVESPLVLLHEGVIPNCHVTMALGCAHYWDAEQLAWRPRLDAFGRTSLAGIAVAGDGGGIRGADAAEQLGALAAHAAAADLGRVKGEDASVRAARRAIEGLRGARTFLDRLYRPAQAQRVPADDATLVCRCEEVTAGEIRRAAALGALGLTQAKAFTRCGMGPCQGRLCGPTVQAVMAAARGLPEQQVPPYRPRPPYKPITLGTLARAGE